MPIDLYLRRYSWPKAKAEEKRGREEATKARTPCRVGCGAGCLDRPANFTVRTT